MLAILEKQTGGAFCSCLCSSSWLYVAEIQPHKVSTCLASSLTIVCDIYSYGVFEACPTAVCLGLSLVSFLSQCLFLLIPCSKNTEMDTENELTLCDCVLLSAYFSTWNLTFVLERSFSGLIMIYLIFWFCEEIKLLKLTCVNWNHQGKICPQ